MHNEVMSLKSLHSICAKLVVNNRYTNPSCLHATVASTVAKLSSHTVPQAALWNISTRPSFIAELRVFTSLSGSPAVVRRSIPIYLQDNNNRTMLNVKCTSTSSS
jgi:hypothetical protein